MKKFEKHYLGKARQVDGLQIIKVSLRVADLLKFVHKYEGEDFVSFEVAKMQTPDKFGREYTVYVNTLVEHEEEPKNESNTPKKTTKRKKTAKAESEEDNPF